MSDAEFFAKVNFQRLTSLDEDFKAWRKQIQEDDKQNALSQLKLPMKDSLKKPKPTLETLLKESQVITGKDLIKRKQDKEKELALFQEALEFEERNRKLRQS